MINITHPDQDKYDRAIEAKQEIARRQIAAIVIPERQELPTIGTVLRDRWFQFDLAGQRDLIARELPFGQWLNRKGYLSRDAADIDKAQTEFQAEM